MRRIALYLTISIAFFFLGNSIGAGSANVMKVEPASLLIQNVVLGEVYDLHKISGISLKIHNQEGRSHNYLLSSHKPSSVGNHKWSKGYAEIPDPDWFWFEKEEVRVEANSMEEVKMFFRIPREERYFNQHWVVTLEVKTKPEQGTLLGLAIYPQMQIETQVKDGLNERPDGYLSTPVFGSNLICRKRCRPHLRVTAFDRLWEV